MSAQPAGTTKVSSLTLDQLSKMFEGLLDKHKTALEASMEQKNDALGTKLKSEIDLVMGAVNDKRLEVTPPAAGQAGPSNDTKLSVVVCRDLLFGSDSTFKFDFAESIDMKQLQIVSTGASESLCKMGEILLVHDLLDMKHAIDHARILRHVIHFCFKQKWGAWRHPPTLPKSTRPAPA